jgi:hypothetical protein
VPSFLLASLASSLSLASFEASVLLSSLCDGIGTGGPSTIFTFTGTDEPQMPVLEMLTSTRDPVGVTSGGIVPERPGLLARRL